MKMRDDHEAKAKKGAYSRNSELVLILQTVRRNIEIYISIPLNRKNLFSGLLGAIVVSLIVRFIIG